MCRDNKENMYLSPTRRCFDEIKVELNNTLHSMPEYRDWSADQVADLPGHGGPVSRFRHKLETYFFPQIGEARITLAKQAGEKIDNRARLEAVRLQEDMIKKEKDQQQKKDEIESEKERVKEEVRSRHLLKLGQICLYVCSIPCHPNTFQHYHKYNNDPHLWVTRLSDI